MLNLVPDKRRAFEEMFRILKPGGHFSVSDVVLRGELPDGLRNDAEMYAGCVSGAIQIETYLQHLHDVGFATITVQKQKAIELPDDILANYLTAEEIATMRDGQTGILSITVYGEKSAATCSPGAGCC